MPSKTSKKKPAVTLPAIPKDIIDQFVSGPMTAEAVNAASMAFKEGMQKGKAVLQEPVMKVEVTRPEDFMGDVIGDLNSRRGQIQGTDSRGNAQVVEAMVPLANMFGYVNQLRSFSQGRANYSMQFSHYEEVPTNVAEEVKAKMA